MLFLLLEVRHEVLDGSFSHLWDQVRNGLFARTEDHLFVFDVLVLVVLVDLQKLLIHDLLGRHEVLPLVIIELDEQRIASMEW